MNLMMAFKQNCHNFCMLCALSMYFAFVTAHNLMEKIPVIMEKFQINQPIIENTFFSQNHLINVVKVLSFNGHSIGLNQNKRHHFQSFIIFSQINNFNWTFHTHAPVLVISNIQQEEDLGKVNVQINDEVLFMDWKSQKVYESYQINNKHIIKYLGQFQDPIEINNEKFIPSHFDQSESYQSPMIKRRKNFHGLELNIITGIKDEKCLGNEDKVYHKHNKTYYDVTNLKNDPKLFWYPIVIPILHILETELNFTSHLFIQEGQKVGSPYFLEDGTISIGDGMFQNIINGSADLILNEMSILPIRRQFVDFLTPFSFGHIAIFIPNREVNEAIDWTAFLDPLSNYVWMAIIFKCIVFASLVYVIEWFHNYKLMPHSIVIKIWAAFIATFGGKPFKCKIDHITSYKTLLFALFLDGVIIWISYRAFLFSELSSKINKYPFNDLDSLAKTDYKLFTGARDTSIFTYLSSETYNKIMKNNIDLDTSFNPIEISIQKVLSEPKTALIHFEGNIPANHRSMLKSVWRSSSPVTYGSLAMKNNSLYTEFFNDVLEELKETGQLEILKKRYHSTNTNFNALSKNDPALGFEKLTSLFVILMIGIILSFFAIILELKMQFHKKNEIEDINEEMIHFETQTRRLLEGALKGKTEKCLKNLLNEYRDQL